MLEPGVVELARGPNYAVVTTFMPDGSAQSMPLWVDADEAGEHLLLNTEVHRQRFKNVQRDPRVTVTILDKDGWFHWAEVRGTVVETVTGPEARAQIDALSEKYFGIPYPNPIESERVILKVAPAKQHLFKM